MVTGWLPVPTCPGDVDLQLRQKVHFTHRHSPWVFSDWWSLRQPLWYDKSHDTQLTHCKMSCIAMVMTSHCIIPHLVALATDGACNTERASVALSGSHSCTERVERTTADHTANQLENERERVREGNQMTLVLQRHVAKLHRFLQFLAENRGL